MRFWIKRGDGPFREVTKLEFCDAEDEVGFHHCHFGELVTGGFGCTNPDITGRITGDVIDYADYSWDMAFYADATNPVNQLVTPQT